MFQLLRVVLTSRAYAGDGEAVVARRAAIIRSAREEDGNLTSAVAHHAGEIVQVLEGLSTTVEHVLELIRVDAVPTPSR